MYKIAVIGTRKLEKAEEVIEKIRKYLNENQIKVDMVRSGNAEGTDQLANSFADDDSISVIHYLPWSNYNESMKIKKSNIHYVHEPTKQFDDSILELFPYTENISEGIRSLIRRNYQIIMGRKGDKPVDLVFWHTNTGVPTSGTRYGVILARHLGIKDIRV